MIGAKSVRADVEKVRASSKAGKFGPWVEWWDEMAKKTVIRRMAKRLPSSADVDQVFESDNEASGFVQVERKEPINITPSPEEQKAPIARLKRSIADRASEVIEPSTGEIIEENANVPATDAQGTL